MTRKSTSIGHPFLLSTHAMELSLRGQTVAATQVFNDALVKPYPRPSGQQTKNKDKFPPIGWGSTAELYGVAWGTWVQHGWGLSGVGNNSSNHKVFSTAPRLH